MRSSKTAKGWKTLEDEGEAGTPDPGFFFAVEFDCRQRRTDEGQKAYAFSV